MKHKILVAAVLLVLVLLGATGVFANPENSIAAQSLLAPEVGQAEAGWEQVGGNGLGDVGATEVSALAAFGSYLYAGTHNAVDGALILRSSDGVTWTAVTQPGFGDAHDIAPPAILDFTEFNGYLYASTGRGDGPAQIRRSASGSFWGAAVVPSGFADQDNVDITALAEYSGMLYAGVTNLTSGVQVWRSFTGDSNSWTQDSPAALIAAPASITGFAVFNGALYALIESDGPAQIWRTYGGSTGWTAVVSDGFGSNSTTLTGGMAVFGNYLYAGVGNTTGGVQLWRSNDGDVWAPATAPGSADTNNKEIESLYVFGGQLYASARNATTGIEVWHSADGALWEQSNQDGFGDSGNTGSNQSNATAEFLSRLFMGTVNTVAGGELWRLAPASLPSYALELSRGSSLSGLPGTTVTHTLTVANTGTVADTYSLETSGSTWPTSLSTTNIALAPGASAQFDVSVAIPPSAMAPDADIVSVTATSQGDPAQSATADLTTTALPTYGVALSGDDALSGSPGTTVTYTLTLTNRGGTVDTYSLAIGGNSWGTSLSASSISLAPVTSDTFWVTVTIPAGAAAGAADNVTVTATSQSDSNVSDAATMTTTCVPAPARLPLYLPLLMQNAARGL